MKVLAVWLLLVLGSNDFLWWQIRMKIKRMDSVKKTTGS